MDFDAVTWLPSPRRRPAVTLTFDLQNLIRSSVGVTGYSIPCKFHRDCSKSVHEISW